MAQKIILSADSTCDIGPELQAQFDVQFFHFHILLDGKSYVDKEEISADEIYTAWYDKKLLPKTAAITPEDYRAFFEQWVADGYDVVHINLGSAISSAHQNCMLVAQELGHVYPVDSASLSTGSGLLVARAGEMIAAGMSAADIQQQLVALREKTHASFVLDTLAFMAAGGRCTAVQAFGANLLGLKPAIRVDNKGGGAMSVYKKYRGKMERVLADYVRDQLEGREGLDLTRAFITYSSAPQEHLDLVRAEMARYQPFKQVYCTVASGTIGSHCGPGTIGVLFMEE